MRGVVAAAVVAHVQHRADCGPLVVLYRDIVRLAAQLGCCSPGRRASLTIQFGFSSAGASLARLGASIALNRPLETFRRARCRSGGGT